MNVIEKEFIIKSLSKLSYKERTGELRKCRNWLESSYEEKVEKLKRTCPWLHSIPAANLCIERDISIEDEKKEIIKNILLSLDSKSESQKRRRASQARNNRSNKYNL